MDVRLECHLASPRLGHQAAAATQNISRSGILVIWKVDPTARLPARGDVVNVEIHLPVHQHYGRKCMYCKATVVRVEPVGEGLVRVALQTRHIEFRPCCQAQPPVALEVIEGKVVM